MHVVVADAREGGLEVQQEKVEQVQMRRSKLGDHLFNRRGHKVDRDRHVEHNCVVFRLRPSELHAGEWRKEDFLFTGMGVSESALVRTGEASGRTAEQPAPFRGGMCSASLARRRG